MVSFNEPCIKSNSKVNLINIQEKEPFYKKVMTVQFVIVKPESVSWQGGCGRLDFVYYVKYIW